MESSSHRHHRRYTSSSSSFHSAAQSFSSEPSLPPPRAVNTRFVDPPILPSTSLPLPSEAASVETPSSCGLSPTVRSCDVYVGVPPGRGSRAMARFVRWLRAELEMQGVSCYVAGRSDREVARVAMDVACFGVVVVAGSSFSSSRCVEEIRTFLRRKNLVPIFFEISQGECNARDIVERRGKVWERFGGVVWERYGGEEAEWMEAVDGLSKIALHLEAHEGNFRDCISEAVVLLASGLGRRGVVNMMKSWKELATDELPFPRNKNFVGRTKELCKLEYLLFGYVASEGVEKHSKEQRGKGKKPMTRKEFEENISASMQGTMDTSSKAMVHKKGIACISGASGIGKTELLLEFAHRFGQRYKMVLWIGGESRFVLQNYMKLLHVLGVDVGIENKFFSERNGPWKFEQIEEIVIHKIKKELMRDIPYLLVIDNLEKEKDWWDGRNIIDLIPHYVGSTHVLISTRLTHVADIKPIRLLYLSEAESMTLIKGKIGEVALEEANALRVIEDRVGRRPLALALVGAILSELPMNATKLLDTINGMPFREPTWIEGEDVSLKRNPFLVQLLDFCFSICEDKTGKLALRMVEACDLFAPASVPMSMLSLAARESFVVQHGFRFWRKDRREATSLRMTPATSQSLDVEAFTLLLKLKIGRMTTNSSCISFHDDFKLYARKRGSDGLADSVVRAVSIEGCLPQQLEHIWAACFLLFKFGSDPAAVHLSVHDLMSFIEQFVLPLGMHCFNALFQCHASLELLRVATETLEALEDSSLADANSRQNKSPCFGSCLQPSMFSDPLVYQKFAHLRATLLEARAKLMLRGSMYDIGERLCRTAVSIKEVIYGWEHRETVSTRETLERLLTFQSLMN